MRIQRVSAIVRAVSLLLPVCSTPCSQTTRRETPLETVLGLIGISPRRPGAPETDASVGRSYLKKTPTQGVSRESISYTSPLGQECDTIPALGRAGSHGVEGGHRAICRNNCAAQSRPVGLIQISFPLHLIRPSQHRIPRKAKPGHRLSSGPGARAEGKGGRQCRCHSYHRFQSSRRGSRR